MNTSLKLLIFFLILSIFGNQNATQAQSHKKSDLEILLIGSSYFNYNDLAGLVNNLCYSAGKDIYIEMCGNNGMYLADHVQSQETQLKIAERDWDIIILQGVGSLMAYPDYFTSNPVYPALIALEDMIHSNCETTRMIFCMPWAYEDGMTWYQNWTDTYEDMQIHIYNNTLLYSDEIGFEIAPVGWAWYGVLDELGYPLHYLHMSDWNHPTIKGSYLMACVIFSTVFAESTVGNEFIAGISHDEVEFFQAVASETVLNNLELWNINASVSVENSFQIDEDMLSFQYYPNPVNDKMKIIFDLPQTSLVKIEIFDASGRKRNELLNSVINRGLFETELSVQGIEQGVYFLRLLAGEYCLTRSFIIE